jgi:hypothetical protein
MDEREQRLLRALAWMTVQFAQGEDDYVWSQGLSAVEDAIASLQEYGLVDSSAKWTETGFRVLGIVPKT